MRTIIFILVFFQAMSTFAQPNLDLCLAKGADHWRIVAKTSEDFQGVFSNLQFTLKLENGLTINSIEQSNEVATYIPIQMAGDLTTIGEVSYQKFAGFGNIHMNSVDISWEKDASIGFLKIIPSNMNANMSLVVNDDPWLEENNGIYYAELNGRNMTGNIYEGCPADAYMVGIDNTTSFTAWNIYPNPTSAQFTLTSSYNGKTEIKLLSPLGQVLKSEEVFFSSGQKYILNVYDLPNGVMFVEILEAERRKVYPVFKR